MIRKDKTILVTGCSTGIGQCVARGLKSRGYRVLATARRQSDVDMLTADGAEALRLDLADQGSVSSAAREALERADGSLYAVINNGAYGQPGAVEDLSREVLRKQFETNLFGTHDLTCRLIPAFRRQGFGRIIQISSILGLVSLSYRGAYNSSKYALEALSDTLRLELRGSGVSVVLIEPGPIATQFRANAYAALLANVNFDNSVHHQQYLKVKDRLTSMNSARFTLPAQAVLDKVIHALESPRPRIRYKVTFPAHALSMLKRWLPDRMMDRLLSRSGEPAGTKEPKAANQGADQESRPDR